MSDIRNFFTVASQKTSKSKESSQNALPPAPAPPKSPRVERSEKRHSKVTKKQEEAKPSQESKQKKSKKASPSKKADVEMKDEESPKKPQKKESSQSKKGAKKASEEEEVVVNKKKKTVVESDEDLPPKRSNKKRSRAEFLELNKKEGEEEDENMRNMQPKRKLIRNADEDDEEEVKQPQQQTKGKKPAVKKEEQMWTDLQKSNKNPPPKKEEAKKKPEPKKEETKKENLKQITPEEFFLGAAYQPKKDEQVKTGMTPQLQKLSINEKADASMQSARNIQKKQSTSPAVGKNSPSAALRSPQNKLVEQTTKKETPKAEKKKGSRKSSASKDSDVMEIDLEELKDTVEDKKSLKNCLEGLTIVLSGEFQDVSRPKLEEQLRDLGAKVTSAVSGKTDYLVVGYKLEDGRDVNQGSKYNQAVQKGTQILNEKTVEELIQERSGVKDYSLSNRKLILDQTTKTQSSLEIQMEKKKSQVIEESKATPDKDGQKKAFPKEAVQALDSNMWTDLYAPRSLTDLVGNSGVVDQLYEWLRDWDEVIIRGQKKDIKPRRGQHWQDLPRVNARACLLSGPPGIGKTSAARIVCSQMGFEVLETNASDTRSKGAIEQQLKELSSNKSLDYFSVAGLKKNATMSPFARAMGGSSTKKSVIIMDEVDGVGAGDRGGINALIQIIKETKTPIICICNERMSPKLASLINYCFDLKFQRPSKDAVLSRIQQIAKVEGLNVDPALLDRVAESSGCDLRQMINVLQMWKHRELNFSMLDQISKDEKVMLNNFDAAHRLLNKNQGSKYSTFRQKLDLFFIDYDLIPLLVQENYLTSMGERKDNQSIEEMAQAADFISFGDEINRQVRIKQDWSLLPNLGFASSIAPTSILKGTLFYPRFPEWMGKNSTQRKSRRLLKELKLVMGHRAQANKRAIQTEYIPLVLEFIYKKIRKGDEDSINEAIEFMDDLSISNDHLKDHLLTLSVDQKVKGNFDGLDAKIKGLFTRIYNKGHKDGVSGKKVSPKKGKKVESDIEEEEDETGLVDELEMMDIKKQREAEKKKKKKLEEEKGKQEETKFEILKPTLKGKGKAAAKPKTEKAKKPAKPKRSKGKKDESESEGSLKDFIVDDSEDEGKGKKKKQAKTKAISKNAKKK